MRNEIHPQNCHMDHQPCAQSQTLCTSNVQSRCLLLGRDWGLEGVGLQRRAGKCNWDTGGLIRIPYCKGLYQSERSHLWGAHLSTTSSLPYYCPQAST